MAQEFTSITEACEAFVLSLAENRFYDAHEDLECIWFPRRFDDDNEVRLWKGLINAAVSFELIKLGRPGPSEKAWGNYLKYKLLLDAVVSEHKELYVKLVQIIENKKVTYV